MCAGETIPQMVKRQVAEAYDETKAAMAKKYPSLTMTPEEANRASAYLARVSNHYRSEVWMAGFYRGLAIGSLGVFALMSYVVFLITR